MDGYLLDISHLDGFQRWSLICAAALTIVYAIMRPWRKRKDPLQRPATLSLSSQREVERQMSELLVELEQMARQMSAQLDTRAARLELLLKEADEKIAKFRAAIEQGGCEPHEARPVSLLPSLPDPRHAQVYELADRGHSARQIAQQVDRPYGEIELILALRPQEHATAAVG